jgi:hypothetical protein
MVPGSQHARSTGPALIRSLARLTALEGPASRPALAERLSQWLRWTDAVSLSAALNASPTAASAPPPTSDKAGAAERELARGRGVLAKAIVEDQLLTPNVLGGDPRAPAAAAGAPAEFTPYRLRYLARQQAMEAGIATLRESVRATLAAASPAQARLAALDAVMEEALYPHERSLLSSVPALLQGRFEALREAGSRSAVPGQAPETAHANAAARETPGGWLEVFCKDMQGVLLAELELRLQPVEALLAALRTSPPTLHG